MKDVLDHFALAPMTVDFVGHCMALQTDDSYLTKPCGPIIQAIKLCLDSFQKFGNSPFIYPIYGLGGLPEGFSRLAAIHGGTYMLNTPVEELLYDENGKFSGIKTSEGTAKAPLLICDPSYVGDNKRRPTDKVVRAICILNGPIPETKDADSCQIIFTASQMKRKNDIYVSMVSGAHAACKPGKYVAMVSTTVETERPEQEIRPALKLLGKIEHIFVTVSTLYEPVDSGKADNVFVSSSFDATSHFESCTTDVFEMWERIHGEKLVLKIPENQDLE